MELEILKPNENPFREGTLKCRAWKLVRGFGGCCVDDCVIALDGEGFARHGTKQVGNRGYLREFHRLGLLNLPGYRSR